MDRLVEEYNENYRTISVSDEQLFNELRLVYNERRDALKRLQRQPETIPEDIDLKFQRNQALHRVVQRFEQMAHQDHIQKFGGGVAA